MTLSRQSLQRRVSAASRTLHCCSLRDCGPTVASATSSPEGLRHGPRLPRQLRRTPPIPATGHAQRPCVSASSLWWRRIRRDLRIVASGKTDLGVGVEGVAGVTSDLGVNLQVTKLWEEGLEDSFCLFKAGALVLPGLSITICGIPWRPQYSTLGLSPAPWDPLLLVTFLVEPVDQGSLLVSHDCISLPFSPVQMLSVAFSWFPPVTLVSLSQDVPPRALHPTSGFCRRLV